MSYAALMVLENMIFKWLHIIFVFLWLYPLWKRPPLWKRLVPWFEQFRIPFIWGWFVLSLIKIVLLALEKILFNINLCKYGFLYCDLSWPPGDHYVNNFESTLSESFHINMSYFGSVVLEKKICKWSHLTFVIISPLKRTCPFIWKI
jgi:hypothetical protein